MSPVMIAGVAIENTSFHFDKLYEYAVPAALAEQVRRGVRVQVPFGAGNARRLGIVMAVRSGVLDRRLKSIVQVVASAPALSEELCALAEYLKEHTFCTIYDAVKCMVPFGMNLKIVAQYAAGEHAGEELGDALDEQEKQIVSFVISQKKFVGRDKILKALDIPADSKVLEKLWRAGYLVRNDEAVRNVGDLSVKMVRLAFREEDGIGLKLSKKQQSVVNLLQEVGCAAVREICYYTGVTQAVPDALVKKGVCEYIEMPALRTPPCDTLVIGRAEINLSQDQQRVYEKLCGHLEEGKTFTALLYGVTGSGKTQVYIKLIDRALDIGRTAIVLVPEISLTPQTLELFRRRYGAEVAVLHSALSIGERADEYKRIQSGKVKIVVGTRSAVFAPLPNIGIIIMDEEQEAAYKSESAPRYHARDVARFRCAYHHALLLLASATPSVETYTAAKTGRYGLYRLTQRYGSARLPQVITVDMLEQLNNGCSGSISIPLIERLRENLESSRQSILLINRRGYHTFVSCPSCKEIVTCPHCSISMTYHAANGRLMCHYCGYSQAYTEHCPHCGHHGLKRTGFGTQRVEEELRELLPEARILRMDADTTAARFSHERKLSAFAAGEYDIMLGTQMVAKGLDFENVTLVGVVSADGQLYSDDYRSLERTFSLLTQVVGRAGRGKYPGSAVIQTMTPENPVIRFAATQDYDSFYDTEMQIRKLMTYPPYCDLCTFTFSGVSQRETELASHSFLQQLKELASAEYANEKLIVLGPAPPRAARISGKYRYRIIVKCRMRAATREMMARLLTGFGLDPRYRNITLFPDVHPESIF